MSFDVFVSVSLLSILGMVLSILQGETTQVFLNLFDAILAAEFGFEKFSRSSEGLFSYFFFFHLRLFDAVTFNTP